ncbi:MCE family protein [Pontibacter sp. KCTC 32443]|uniref:MlaD family protein n=1 Tax=Pontibacter TaxID=323449 RepID=UPI00164D62B2|nr:MULTISPECIES: MlaD family protein [Pontibacter]MBC5773886.1 MCE family protein [Pontibacter sp. KCTC 32443]
MKIRKEIKVALLGIVALVILYFGFKFLKGAELFSDTRTFYVVYNNVDGLTASNPVMLNGVQVGSVQELKLMPKEHNHILVSIEVQEDLQIGDSTIAALASSDLLGSKAITLYLGNSKKMYKGGERLIPFNEKSIADMLSSKAVPVIDKVDTTLARVNRLLDSEAKQNIQLILANTQATTEALNQMLRANQRNINDITTNTNRLMASLVKTQRHIDRVALNMAEITDTLKRAEVNKLVDNANKAVMEMQQTVAKLNSNQGSMGKLMNDDVLYENMARSTEALNMLLRDIQAYPKRYVQFSLIGRKDKYKVDATGRVITLEEVKEMQDENPDEFRRPVPDTLKVPLKTDTTKSK